MSPRVYLGGPIGGCTSFEVFNWRQEFGDRLASVGFAVADPSERDYRGNESGNEREIVEPDLAEIDTCEIVFANCWRPSWGTGMEVFYAYRCGKVVVCCVPHPVQPSPWLVYHSDVIAQSLDGAATYLEERFAHLLPK